MRKSLVAFFSLIAFVPGVFAQGGGVQTASVTLTSAQVQHLHASPVQLVASPGAGQFVDVISVAYQYRAGSTPYALSNGGNFVVGPAAIFPTSATGFIDQTSNTVAVAGKSTETVYQSVVENLQSSSAAIGTHAIHQLQRSRSQSRSQRIRRHVSSGIRSWLRQRTRNGF
jgi:hypothetical protein